jgi:hypothetical protein
VTGPVYVIAPLETSAADRERIEAIRRVHDPQQPIVPPHVTLVFGARLATPERVLAQAAGAAARWAPIDIVLDRAEVERGAATGRAHVFLMPGVGETPLRALHAALHAGALADDLNRPSPSRPTSRWPPCRPRPRRRPWRQASTSAAFRSPGA